MKEQVAHELASKDGCVFDDQTEVMKNAYLHNAEEAIKDRAEVAVNPVTGKAGFTCQRCEDKAYIDGKKCLECNPVGLPAEQVHPGAIVVADITVPLNQNIVTKVAAEMIEELADESLPGVYLTVDVNAEELAKTVVEGVAEELAEAIKGVTNDNSGTEQPVESIPDRVLNSKEYICSKCSKSGLTIIHRSTSAAGKKHLEFKGI